MAYRIVDNKYLGMATIAVTSNSTLTIAGSSTSDIASNNEVVYGATINNINVNMQGNGYCQISRGSNTIFIADSSAQLDFKGNGSALTLDNDATLDFKLFGSGFVILNLTKISANQPITVGPTSGAYDLYNTYTSDSGFAIDFQDDFFIDDGFYGSAYIKDLTDPGNDYDSYPYGLLNYSSPSIKMTLGSDGFLRFGAHNLYLNSASPADQSITVRSGAEYTITITGSVSITASGANSGTWTAGSNTFATSTNTLTLGSTTGSGTVHVRRKTSDSTYLETTSAIKIALPYEWDTNGNLLGIRIEAAATNLFTVSKLGSWTAVNTTITADNATGPDGLTSAALIEATAGTTRRISRAVTLSDATAYTFTAILKAGTCSYMQLLGNADIQAYCNFDLSTGTVGSAGSKSSGQIKSLGNGWWAASVTFNNTTTKATSLFLHLVANNTVGYNGTLDVSGNIYAWEAQIEAGNTPTSIIITRGASITRAVDTIKISQASFPWNGGTGDYYIDGISETPTTSGTDLVLNTRSGETHVESIIWMPT